jgi:hypothetical protein
MNGKHREARISTLLLKNSVAAILIAGSAWLLKNWTSSRATDALLKKRQRQQPERLTPETEERGASCVVGVFSEEETIVEAARAVRAEWTDEYRVYSPNLNEDLLETLNLPQSGTRIWILVGGAIGQLGGWVTTIMLSIYYPHPVASMPIIAVPPFAIISFEMMVLFGAGAGFVAVLLYCGLPNSRTTPEIYQRFKQDRFGIVLMCENSEQVLKARILLEHHRVESIAYL